MATHSLIPYSSSWTHHACGTLAPVCCRTMVTQLVEHERICTTLAKAKALQRYADRLITLGKRVSKGSDRLV